MRRLLNARVALAGAGCERGCLVVASRLGESSAGYTCEGIEL
jgi:hypothetical protein